MSPEERERRYRVFKATLVLACATFVLYFGGLWLLTGWVGFLALTMGLIALGIAAVIVL